MADISPRWVLDVPAIRAGIVGDVLCVELRGQFTARELNVSLLRLREAILKLDYGALMLNVIRAQLDFTAEQLASIWLSAENCPLAARPCAVVYDGRECGDTALFETLALRLADGYPMVLMGAFDVGLLMDATSWASRRAHNYRAEQARREMKASGRASSGRAYRRLSTDRRRS